MKREHMRRVRGLIIGGGPAGLAVAHELQGDTLVLEKEEEVGGLCRSVEQDGGFFDIGGHSFHTPHPHVRELVDGVLDGGLFLQQRDARVFSHGTLLPYPFQKSFDAIPDPAVVAECEAGLRAVTQAAEGPPPRNFEEFIVQKFGQGIAEHFMLPYNRKLWARDIKKISCEWTAERVAAPKGEQERFDTSGGARKPLQADTRVGYPQDGGFVEIFRALAHHVPEVQTDTEIVRVDPVGRVAHARDGRAFSWDFLVTTMPLPELVRVVEGTPAQVVAMADALEYMSLRVELLLVGRRLETEIQRIYSADPDIPAHKMAFNHNSSDGLRARDRHAIMCEVSLSPEKPVDVERIADRQIEFFTDLGILKGPEDIVWRSHVDVKYAYPVYTHQRPELVAGIRGWLEEHDIHTVGRFGDWEYINSDKCVHKGLALGRELRSRYPGPGVPMANARSPR